MKSQIQTYTKTSNEIELRAEQIPLISSPKGMQLLECKLIQDQVREHGEESVLYIIKTALKKLAISMYGEIRDSAKSQIQVISEDLVSKYPTDSIEDIIEAIKKGRRNHNNKYPNPYNRFNMELFNGWISTQLEEKAEQREKTKVIESKEPIPDIDYSTAIYKKKKREKPKTEEDKEIDLINYYKNITANLGFNFQCSDEAKKRTLETLLQGYSNNLRLYDKEKVNKIINNLKKGK